MEDEFSHIAVRQMDFRTGNSLWIWSEMPRSSTESGAWPVSSFSFTVGNGKTSWHWLHKKVRNLGLKGISVSGAPLTPCASFSDIARIDFFELD